MKREVQVLLDNIRSSHNVGSVFRTCDGAGVSKLCLAGYTPAPVDRFGRFQPEIKKTSLGAIETVPWEQVEESDIESKLKNLKEEGFCIVAVEQDARAVPISEFETAAHSKICYIFGNEIDGVSKKILDLADSIIHIPMRGEKESLNVSVTVGIVLFTLNIT